MTTNNIMLALTLLFAHLVGDFLFQSDRMVRQKGKLWWVIVHGLINGLLVYLLVGAWSLWLPVAIIAVTHVIIDLSKGTLIKHNCECDSVWVFLADQFLHLAILALIYCLFYLPLQGIPLWISFYPNFSYKVLVFMTSLLLILPFSGVFIGYLMKPYQNQLNKRFRPNSLRSVSGLKEGGRIIGYLERLLIYVFILSGQFAGVGFLVAAKSIFRFGELKDSENRKQAEYIIIGTFTSFLLAILISLGVQALLKIVAG